GERATIRRRRTLREDTPTDADHETPAAAQDPWGSRPASGENDDHQELRQLRPRAGGSRGSGGDEGAMPGLRGHERDSGSAGGGGGGCGGFGGGSGSGWRWRRGAGAGAGPRGGGGVSTGCGAR